MFARTDDTEGKMTAFIVEAGWPGVSHGPHEQKMGIRSSSTTTVAFSDVRVPADCVLGEPGKGFKVAMAILNNGRTGLGGGAVGGMKALIALSTQQAKDRKQFGRPIAEFGLIREKIAHMAVDCFAAESTVWMVAHYIDSGCSDYSTEAAISKVFASDAIQRHAHEALQIAAGNGFMKEFPYEKVQRDSRILSIFEGTNEILRLYIALSGMKDVGASLSDLKHAIGDIFNNPIKGFGVLQDYAAKHAQLATGAKRQGTHDTKERSEISGGCRTLLASAPTTSCGGCTHVCRRWRRPTKNIRSNWHVCPTACCASTAKASPTTSTSRSAPPISPSTCSLAYAHCRVPTPSTRPATQPPSRR